MRYYTVKEAAEVIGKSDDTVRRLIRKGYLEARLPYGYERGMLISEEAIERWRNAMAPVR